MKNNVLEPLPCKRCREDECECWGVSDDDWYEREDDEYGYGEDSHRARDEYDNYDNGYDGWSGFPG